MDANNAFSTLTAAFSHRADRLALGFGDRRFTYADLERQARGHARALVHSVGLSRGARIAVFAQPAAAVVIALLAHYQAGLIHVPINTRYRAAEVGHILTDADVAAIVTDSAGLPIIEEVVERHAELVQIPRILLDATAGAARPGDYHFADLHIPEEGDREGDGGTHEGADLPTPSDEDPALIIYTSGTTGPSKGAVLSMGAVVGAMKALTSLWQFSGDDTLVLALPLFHVHGLGIGVHGSLIHGTAMELLPRFTPRAVVDAIARGGTIFMGVPTMYHKLLEYIDAHPRDAEILARARLFTAGSAALPAADFARFAALTGHHILERYGMTETLITLSNPYEGERRPGSVGMPVSGYEVRIMGDGDSAETGPAAESGPRPQQGELAVRGVGLMSEYWRNPKATQAAFRDGWFLTGDVASRSEDGYIRLLGRRSVDIIKSGGFKISAREIEEVIAAHEQVAHVAVIGIEDPAWGQKITAAVVLAAQTVKDDTDSADDADEIVDPVGADELVGPSLLQALASWTSERLADYKKPRALVILDELPRNALGKIQKNALIKAIQAGQHHLIE